MKRTWAPTLLAAALLFAGCGTGPTDVAGGSGAGNPGGGAVVALRADTTTVSLPMSKALHTRDSAMSIIPLADSGALRFQALSAWVTIYEIQFLLDEPKNCAALIDSFDTNLAPMLSCDIEGIGLKGPFVFDLITQKADPLFDTLRLPVANYRGIKLAVGCDSDGNGVQCATTVIAGTFGYGDSTRAFTFEVPFSTVLLCKYIGAPVLLDLTSSALFEVTVGAGGWLNGVNLAGALNSGTIALDSTGNLSLGQPGASPAVQAMLRTIGDNLSASFRSARFRMLLQR